MCGIAGFSAAPGVRFDASLLVRLLIAGLAERGEDACGYATRRQDTGEIEIVKAALPPHRFLAEHAVEIEPGRSVGVVHVRDFTKGRPACDANNHPIRHGRVVGIHNGRIQNDDELFTTFGRGRQEPGMTVDSEAIFMLLDVFSQTPEAAFPRLRGSYSAAWMHDDDDPSLLHLVRGRGRPLAIGASPGLTIFASTMHALAFAGLRMGLTLRPHTVPPGTMLTLRDGLQIATRPIDVQPFEESGIVTYSPDHPNARNARALMEDRDAGAPGA